MLRTIRENFLANPYRAGQEWAPGGAHLTATLQKLLSCQINNDLLDNFGCSKDTSLVTLTLCHSISSRVIYNLQGRHVLGRCIQINEHAPLVKVPQTPCCQ